MEFDEKIVRSLGSFLEFAKHSVSMLQSCFVKKTKDEDGSFELSKITKASTKTAALNFYMDSFGIEKVRVEAALYDTNKPKEERSITAYIEFEELAVLAADATSGRLLKKISEAGKTGYRLGYKGSTSSKTYGGKPESRYISFGMNGNSIFVNLVRCQGVLTSTGGIAPDENRDKSKDLKIGVPVSIEKFRSILIYSYDFVQAYLVGYTNATYLKVQKQKFDRLEQKKE